MIFIFGCVYRMWVVVEHEAFKGDQQAFFGGWGELTIDLGPLDDMALLQPWGKSDFLLTTIYELTSVVIPTSAGMPRCLFSLIP